MPSHFACGYHIKATNVSVPTLLAAVAALPTNDDYTTNVLNLNIFSDTTTNLGATVTRVVTYVRNLGPDPIPDDAQMAAALTKLYASEWAAALIAPVIGDPVVFP